MDIFSLNMKMYLMSDNTSKCELLNLHYTCILPKGKMIFRRHFVHDVWWHLYTYTFVALNLFIHIWLFVFFKFISLIVKKVFLLCLCYFCSADHAGLDPCKWEQHLSFVHTPLQHSCITNISIIFYNSSMQHTAPQIVSCSTPLQ